MTTIYLVTDGSYSDYHICGVYDTQEKAELAKNILHADEIEEFELNDMPDIPPGMLGWMVNIQRDGIARAFRTGVIQSGGELWPAPEGGMFTYVYARDERYAIKIANERRTQAIALGTWKESRI